MRALHWITGVSVLTGMVFFIFGLFGSLWTALLLSMSVVVFYFFILLVYIIQKSQSNWDRVIGIGVLVLLTGFALRSGLSSYSFAKWNHQLLTKKIRSTIDRGILAVHLNTPLLKTLKTRYRGNPETQNLYRLFMEQNRGQLEQSGNLTRYIPRDQQKEHRDDPPLLYYDSTETADKIVLVGHSGFGNGKQPDFTNYDGSRGNLQYKAILTPKGVNYVKEN